MEQNQNNIEWKFESEEDQEMGIESAMLDDGSRFRRAKLSDGRIAVAKRLKGRDAKEVQRLTGKDPDNYKNAVISMCVEIDGVKLFPDQLDDLWLDDVTLITVLASVNFPTPTK